MVSAEVANPQTSQWRQCKPRDADKDTLYVVVWEEQQSRRPLLEYQGGGCTPSLIISASPMTRKHAGRYEMP